LSLDDESYTIVPEEREGMLQIAKNMKERNIPVDIIAKCTELSTEEIERI